MIINFNSILGKWKQKSNLFVCLYSVHSILENWGLENKHKM